MEVEQTVTLPTEQLSQLDALLNDPSTTLTDPNVQQQGDALIHTLKKQFRHILADPLGTKTTNPTEHDFVTHLLESAALFTLKTGRPNTFDRAYKQLSPFYHSASHRPSQWLMVGLSLLCALARGDTSGFHSALELIPPKVLAEDPHIRYAVNLEQSLMEGRYSNVLRLMAAEAVPSAWYGCVLSGMRGAIRDDIAGCVEAAYVSLDVEKCKKFLLFGAEESLEFQKYAEEREWTFSDEEGKKRVRFDKAKRKNAEDEVSMSSEKLARDSVAYSNELEKIVI